MKTEQQLKVALWVTLAWTPLHYIDNEPYFFAHEILVLYGITNELYLNTFRYFDKWTRNFIAFKKLFR